MKVIVASKNPVKINSTLQAFQKAFPTGQFDVEGVSVQSGVPDQPMSNKETYQGAMNRASNAQSEYPDADYWVGLEGGIIEADGEMEAFAWMIIKSSSKTGKSKTATFILPKKLTKLIKEGKELGEACDLVFEQHNSKQDSGTIGMLTNMLIDRTTYYEHALILALIPFMQKNLY